MNDSAIRQLVLEIEQLGSCLLEKSISKDFSIQVKKDGSNVTSADIFSDTCIKKIINNLFGNVSVVSEETADDIDDADNYFIVDPIDGTDYFINQSDFSINIAYVLNGHPVFGLVHIPTQKQTIFTSNNSVFLKKQEETIKIEPKKPSGAISVSASKSSFSDYFKSKFNELIDSLKQNGYSIGEIKTSNASKKYTDVIIGESGVGVTFTRISSWDIAPIIPMAEIMGYKLTCAEGNKIPFSKLVKYEKGVVLKSL